MKASSAVIVLTASLLTAFCGNSVSRADLLAGKLSDSEVVRPVLVKPKPSEAIISEKKSIPFAWVLDDNVTAYRLEVYDDESYTNLITEQTGITGSSALVAIPDEGSYFYKLVPVNFADYATEGKVHVIKDSVKVYCPQSAASCESSYGYGTKNYPYRSIAQGIQKALELSLPLHIAARGGSAVYDESFTIGAQIIIEGAYNSSFQKDNSQETIISSSNNPLVKIYGSADSTIKDITITTESAEQDASAVYLESAGPVNFENVKLKATQTRIDHRIYTLFSDNSVVNLTNSEVNSSERGISAQDAHNSGRKITISNSTLTCNDICIQGTITDFEVNASTLTSTNIASTGGAISGTVFGLVMNNSTINSNKYSVSIDTGLPDTVTIQNSTLNGNFRIDGGHDTITLKNNRIFTSTGVNNAIAISSDSAAAYTVTIDGNLIQSTNTGVSFSYASNSDINLRNNQILVQAASGDAYGVYLYQVATTIANNTIYTSSSAAGTAKGIFAGSSLGNKSIKNNVVTTANAGTQHCLSEGSSSADFHEVLNNNLYGCSVLYKDENASDRTIIADVNDATRTTGGAAATSQGNVSIDNTANQLFVDFDGPDNDLSTTADNNWQLNIGNATICNVVYGGLDLSVTFATDSAGTARTATLPGGSPCTTTNTSAAGWSMGAFEGN